MKVYLLIIVLLSFSEKLIPQIKVIDIDKINVVQKNTKIEPYDSLNNFIINGQLNYNEISNLSSLLGLELFLPQNNYVDGYISRLSSSDITNKYFKIIDTVKTSEEYYSTTFWFKNEKVFLESPILILKEKETGDTLFISMKESHFIVVPYYIKQKQLFDGKLLTCVNSPTYSLKKELKSGREIKIDKNSKWRCEVVISKFSDFEDGTIVYGTNNYEIYYLLTNNKGEKIAFLDGMGFSINYSGFWDTYTDFIFLTDNEVAKIQKEKRKKENEKKASELLKKEKFRQDCIKRFGLRYGNLIANGQVSIGMTKEMCKAAWGNALSINKTTTIEGVTEIWIYGLNRLLYFKNNSLVRIDE